ncbi:MAG: nitrate- and nitrite sensing domain-containing protein [Actinomycetota bacterium]|nr:nitrate- and nitrite sensing domain-containing protein [Actinomycetota bacterium]
MRGGVAALGFCGAPAAGILAQRRGGRWRLRDWRLRTKLTAVLLVPLLLAGVLGVLRVTELVGKAHDFAALARRIGLAQQLGLVMYDLQRERHLVAAMLATGGTANRTGLQNQSQRVDAAVATLRTANFPTDAIGSTVDGQRVPAREAALSRLSGLAALREAALRPSGAPGAANAGLTVNAYSELIAGLHDIHRRVLDGAPEPFARQADGLKALAVAKEQASWQHAVLLTGILSGGLAAEQQAMLRTSDARFAAATDEFVQAVSGEQRQFYVNTRAVVDRKRLLDAALTRAQRGTPLETVPGDWNSAAVGTVEAIRQDETNLLNELRTDTVARSNRAWQEAFWNGSAVAALLVLAVVLLIVVVRSLLRPLRTLRTAAFEVADRRLPEAAEQLRTTDGTPSQATVDPVPVHSREEVGQVARAFDTVHMQAVRLASEQAQLRCSLNDIFRKLSERSHGLVEQQLRLIDELRGKVNDPELGTYLLQLDRLAARMRRHSENLLVIAGGTVGDEVEGPVAVVEVFRRALSEVEQYQRVTVGPSPAATVAGPVVKDLVHLIAELLDNAIDAAPQGTTVTLGSALAENNGLLVEITDSGPGLPPDELQAINARLGSAPPVDAPVSGQMGVFVVSSLAVQHGLTVRLRPRPGASGIAATVLLPPSLVTVDLRVPGDGHVAGTSPRSADDTARRGSGPDRPPADAPAVSAVNGWSGTDAQLPLQVSVVDEAATADLFSPSSIGVVTSPGSRPRTAHEEWLELFGQHKPQAQNEPLFDPLGTMAGAPVGGRHGQQEVREEIFEMVSAWFRERQAASESSPPATTEPDWQSPFDEGWQAAQALHGPLDHELTQAGLPKRQPLAHLVSGTDSPAPPTSAPTAPVRTPDAVRARLSRYQRGLRVGRHARIDPDDVDHIDADAATAVQPVWTNTTQRPFEQ